MEDVELLIDEYLDGRMEPEARARFEDRLKREPELRDRVENATRSVDLVQKALGWVTPGEDFDEKVTSKIIILSTSAQNLRPALPASERSLTSDDPDAVLLRDPDAKKEKRRLLLIAVAAAVLFAAAVVAIVYVITRNAG